ncbi:hypothetical protein BDR26DRAFT_1004945 [Obelidium mucronatum]|nr:hypothetical protein BDR26DRAFT_1004945 [Obelidium mucronatum]
MGRISSSDDEASLDDDAIQQKQSSSPALDYLFDEDGNEFEEDTDLETASQKENTFSQKANQSNASKTKLQDPGESLILILNSFIYYYQNVRGSIKIKRTAKTRPNAPNITQTLHRSNSQPENTRPMPPILPDVAFTAVMNPERKAAIYKTFKEEALKTDLFPVRCPGQEATAWNAFATLLGRSVPETQVLYSSQKLALFKYKYRSDVLFAAASFFQSNNPYKLPDGSDAASAAAAELITSDGRYLFISKQSDTGRLKLQSQFLNPAFLQVAIEITRDSSVSKICNFRELSKRPEYMFACAVITRHLLERIALQRTGNFNESCSSALVYSEYMEMLANPLTKERMEAKAKQFYSELEKKIKNAPAVEKQNFPDAIATTTSVVFNNTKYFVIHKDEQAGHVKAKRGPVVLVLLKLSCGSTALFTESRDREPIINVAFEKICQEWR